MNEPGADCELCGGTGVVTRTQIEQNMIEEVDRQIAKWPRWKQIALASVFGVSLSVEPDN